jgi:propanol-preferring alcohol dehydrogenase
MDLVQRPLMDPAAGRARLGIGACGICHSDSATMDGLIPGIVYPRMPGHEVVGRIDALGEGDSSWIIGQPVSVGFLGGHRGV